MQFQKQDIREKILTAARAEFLNVGFEKASIRNITAMAQTSKSNVYNYFPDKESLFAAVLEPTTSEIKAGFEKLRAENPGNAARGYSLHAQKEVIEKIMGFVFNHREDLKLLLFQASGSKLSGFKDTVTVLLAEVLSDWVAYAAPKKEISSFFVQMVAGFYISAIEKMLINNITCAQASEHLDDFLKFVYGGWQSVL